MISSKRRHTGFTIVEMILVLTIISALILLGMQQIQIYRRYQQIYTVQSNVDMIFQAMQAYYRANCYGVVNGAGQVQPGTLNPLNSNFQTGLTSQTINLTTDLINKGYLTETLAFSPLLNSTSSTSGISGTGGMSGTGGTSGPEYALQFNPYTQTKYVCTSAPGAGPSPNPVPGCTSPVGNVGTIVTWQSQVAVLLSDPNTALQYLSLLGGDCLSSANKSGIIAPCTGYPGSGSYVVWERSPSVTRAKTNAYEWETTPTVTQFKQMYTTYQINYLLGSQGQVTNQYYLCGG